jgi:hypothetical protein
LKKVLLAEPIDEAGMKVPRKVDILISPTLRRIGGSTLKEV